MRTTDSFLNPRLAVPRDMPMGLCKTLLDIFCWDYCISDIRKNIQECSYMPMDIRVTHAVLSDFEPISLSMLLDIVLKLKSTFSPLTYCSLLFQQSY